MSVADILQKAGFVPSVPTCPQPGVDAETVACQCVPNVPTVPNENDRREGKGEKMAPPQTAHLLALSDAEGVDAALVHELPEDDVATCTGLPDSALRAFLRARQASADRMAGRIPTSETAAILCARCGPVCASPDVAGALPVVDGWPRALGCPWCHVREALKPIPRPPATCATCRHCRPDALNPGTGMGECTDGHGHHYPMQRHRCGDYRPRGQT